MVDAHTSEGDENDAADVDALLREIAELRAENDRMRSLLGVGTRDEAVSPWEPTLFIEVDADVNVPLVDRNSRHEAKVALFRSLFVGRDDVHVVRWENPRSGKYQETSQRLRLKQLLQSSNFG
ncbi:MAG: hypothetical protein ABSH04_03385 [Acidimicrobiales bacterium]